MLLIHVGYHKTGTTWLQNHLFNREDMGYTSPWGGQAGEAVDAFVVCNPFRFDPIAAREVFAEGIKNATNRSLIPVISNEAMCGGVNPRHRYEKNVADRLYQTFPEAKILVTIREQKVAVLSHYREKIASGGVETISEYLSKPWHKPGFAPPCSIDHFEYDLFVEYYQKLFGKHRVLVLPQELLKSDRQFFCDQLADFLEIPHGSAPESKDSRVGWRGWSLLYRLRCNQLHLGVNTGPKSRNSLMYKLVQKLGKVIATLTPKTWDEEVETRLKSEVKEKIGDYFAHSNERLQKLTDLDLKNLGYDLPS